MGSAWWSKPASFLIPHPSSLAPTNVFRATWTPDCDVGARAYTCFVGITGTVYHAAFQLRLRPSPGAVPNVIAVPPRVLDLANTVVINAPWPTDATIDASIRRVIHEDGITAEVNPAEIRVIVTNTVDRAYVEGLGISAGLDTNAVREIVGEETGDKRDKADMAVWERGLVVRFECDYAGTTYRYDPVAGQSAAWVCPAFASYGVSTLSRVDGEWNLTLVEGGPAFRSYEPAGAERLEFGPDGRFALVRHAERTGPLEETGDTLATAAGVAGKRDKGDMRAYGDGVKWFRADGTAITLYHVLHNDEGYESWYWQTEKDWHEGSPGAYLGWADSDAAGDEDELVLGGGGDYYGVAVTRDSLALASEIAAATNGLAKVSEVDEKIATAGHVTQEEAEAVAEEAVENAVTTYAQTEAVVALNQSVQSVTVAEGQTLTIEVPSGGGAKDWIVYANCATNTPLVLPQGQYYATGEAVTNDLAPGITALYFTSCRDGIAIGRQELKPIVIGE